MFNPYAYVHWLPILSSVTSACRLITGFIQIFIGRIRDFHLFNPSLSQIPPSLGLIGDIHHESISASTSRLPIFLLLGGASQGL